MPDPHTKKTKASALMDQLTTPVPGRNAKTVSRESIVGDLNRIRNEAVRLLKTITSAGGSVASDPNVNVSPWKEQATPLAVGILKDGRSLENSIKSFDDRISSISVLEDLDVIFNDALMLTQDIACTIENYQNATVPMVEELFRIQQAAAPKEIPDNVAK